MNERRTLIEWVRGEIVGPSNFGNPGVAGFVDRVFKDPVAKRKGRLAWKPRPDGPLEEVLYFEGESPNRKYGAGLLHPQEEAPQSPSDMAAAATDTQGVDASDRDEREDSQPDADDYAEEAGETAAGSASDDFEVCGESTRKPSTMGISFCVELAADASLEVHLPSLQKFSWQLPDDPPLAVNGRYEKCSRHWINDSGQERRDPVWRRLPALGNGVTVAFQAAELCHGKTLRRNVPTPADTPISLRLDCFPRQLKGQSGKWLVTIVLRNVTLMTDAVDARELVLYQSFFEVRADKGRILPYPEGRRPFDNLDPDEQSLALLYRESATYGTGHGCAAAWNCGPGEVPKAIQADVMPTVELPSMTPDIMLGDQPLRLSMRELATLPEDGTGTAWESLRLVHEGYNRWIEQRRQKAADLPANLREVAERHLDLCMECLGRIRDGIELLESSKDDRDAFRMANLAMLQQQIATKQLRKRSASWDESRNRARINEPYVSPWDIYARAGEEAGRIGSWRAFQIAFLLMSLRGLSDPREPDRKTVDLIWFPTGGGKTEAYLATMSFYMFRERLKMQVHSGNELARDGTNVLMRYTLRMLTTQQFQRAASLICAMEEMRRDPARSGRKIPGRRFSLGLWLGSEGSPNRIDAARSEVSRYLKGEVSGNPLVLTECPWCRAPIGRLEGGGRRGRGRPAAHPLGISDDRSEGPSLLCPDPACTFGVEDRNRWLPVEVIDERIYRKPPSLVIGTADKFAMLAYRPEAGMLFGRDRAHDNVAQVSMPPGLIIQDELHLISGPLGTMYALYEAVFERLCTVELPRGVVVRPKIIASTATIRGADDQVRVLYGRERTRLFPSPGLSMGDSFFGRYACGSDGRLSPGRLYVGIHAIDHGSILTTQVRAFSAALCCPATFEAQRRDPWWTLLAFYNSIRELGGARTLFDSDIRSRMKFLFNREGAEGEARRNLQVVEELTSRLSQPEIVGMMDKLSQSYGSADGQGIFDACLASNIIEVGVDIDRLSLMGVVGQPKTTSSYIQVTGRVGRRWQDRAGLILMIYNPSKSRDRSHFEQFHSYHRRLYERVEPTSATPFARSAIQRGGAGAMLAWIRQRVNRPVHELASHERALDEALDLLGERCEVVQDLKADLDRSMRELQRVHHELLAKWNRSPQKWEEFPQSPTGEYLMLWPGQFATALQKQRGIQVPTSMRQVDRTAELTITPGYAGMTLPVSPHGSADETKGSGD
jgi:hypothetical protein